LLGLAYEQLGDAKAAIACFEQLSGAERNALEAALYARTGRRAEAMATLREIGPKEGFESDCTPEIALAWIALGDRNRGYTYMKATPPPNRIEHNFLALDPRLDPLRSDIRFKEWTAPD
jgi:tetratricopeptide (TPR) repeat protein